MIHLNSFLRVYLLVDNYQVEDASTLDELVIIYIVLTCCVESVLEIYSL